MTARSPDRTIVEAALEYAAACHVLQWEAVTTELLDALGRRELAFHNLLVACGYPCQCEAGTCPADTARPTVDVDAGGLV